MHVLKEHYSEIQGESDIESKCLLKWFEIFYIPNLIPNIFQITILETFSSRTFKNRVCCIQGEGWLIVCNELTRKSFLQTFPNPAPTVIVQR